MAAAEAGARECGEPGQGGRQALYFCGSIRGGREDWALYERIVSRLRRFGAVLTEHVAAKELSARGEEVAGGDSFIHERDLAWLQQADVLSAMIRGAADGSKFQVLDYEEGQVEAMLDRYFEADPPLAGSCHP
ncbi:deoxyribonucleoside 5-monophosphate [Lynx pardinus]|uniref:Deoxyribonucleoside 5-monophosphate n=1 Tax=Lynx pardinus TaxID=191816 RepID=A0A485PKX0_LYNPA|nr:deoxyribonucleoside 5-monophosphate [Lynx pardinus]